MPASRSRRVAAGICSTRVPFSIASRIRCEPDSAPIQAVRHPRHAERGGNVRRHLIGPQQTLEWNHRVARAHELGEPLDPAGLEAEDVVGDPQVIRVIRALQPGHFVDDALGRTRAVPLPVDRLRAPVAVVRAAARRHEIHGEVAVPAHPHGAIAFHVDEIPGGKRQRVGIADDVARRACGSPGRRPSRRHTPSTPFNSPRTPSAQHVQHVGQRQLAFAGDDDVGSAIEIQLRVIAGVGSRHDRRGCAARAPRRSS